VGRIDKVDQLRSANGVLKIEPIETNPSLESQEEKMRKYSE